MGFALWALMGSEIERKGSFIHAEGAQNGHLRVVFKASRAENTMRRGGLAVVDLPSVSLTAVLEWVEPCPSRKVHSKDATMRLSKIAVQNAEGAQNGHLRVVFEASRAHHAMRRGGFA